MTFTRNRKPLLAPVVMLALWLLAGAMPATAAEQPILPASPTAVPNPATELWREVRQRDAAMHGRTQVQGVDAGVLIDARGEKFREFRRDELIGKAAMLIGAVALLILIFFLLRGRIRIPNGRSGLKVKRFAAFDRFVHWFAAILFIVLAVTGLTLLFGRFALLPFIGPEAFGAVANVFKPIHDFVSPLFLVAVILLAVRFISKNWPKWRDIKWLLKGGGVIGNGHVSAGFFNAGEKIWFWAIMVLGSVLCATGLVLLFPIFGQGRDLMQLALTIHAIVAVLLVVGSFGHIYIGTLGMEGSIESMTTGYVDANWAKAHHDLWYEEVAATAQREEEIDARSGRRAPPMHPSSRTS